MKVSFKVKKTGKASKYSYTSKVNVIEDKLTMTAEATHANEIVATFNKAVGSDAKVTLTKGSTDVANTAKIADDGKSATITLTGKLTDGTYTVTVVAGEDTVTANVEAKNEVLTKFEIGTTVKEKTKASDKATATLSYKALNQYGDKINYTPAMEAVTVSIGKVTKVTPCKTSGAGEITIEEIPNMYAIPGQSFAVVIVDTINNTGVTLNSTAVYGASATATQFTAAGVYSVNKSAFKDIADGDVIGNGDRFMLLFTVKDQYDDDMAAKDAAALVSDGAISVTVAGGLTNIKAVDASNLKGTDNEKCIKEIGDTTYFAVPLTNANASAQKANAGTYTVTIVNNTKGIVYTGEYSVTSGTVIESIDINQKDTIYADQDNELDYTVTDTQGNTITDYATLKDIEIKGSATNEAKAFSWKKNANGSAKLVYHPDVLTTGTNSRDFTKSEVRACTITANKAESGKYLVKSKTFSVYVQRYPVAVTGLASSATTVTTTGNLEVKLEHLVVLDQYQNPYTATELKGNATIGNDVIVTTKSAIVTGQAVASDGTDITNDLKTMNKSFGKVVTMSGLTAQYPTLKLNFAVSNAAANYTGAMKNGNDYTATFTVGDSQNVSGLYVDNVNDGCPIQVNGVSYKGYLSGKGVAGYSQDDINLDPSWGTVVVKGIVNGKTVTIDPSQYSFVGADGNALAIAGVQSYELAQKVITETREFSIVVSTADGAQTITGKVDVSNAPATAKTVSAKDNVTTTFEVASDDAVGIGKEAFSYASADELFTVKTQYNTLTSSCELVTYTVESAKVTSGSGLTIDKDTYNTNDSIPVSYIKSYLDGSNRNFLYVDSAVKAPAGTELTVKVNVTANVAGSDSTASKAITLTIKF